MNREDMEILYNDMTHDELGFILKNVKLSYNKLAEQLNINPTTLYRWRMSDSMPYVLIDSLNQILRPDTMLHLRLKYIKQRKSA